MNPLTDSVQRPWLVALMRALEATGYCKHDWAERVEVLEGEGLYCSHCLGLGIVAMEGKDVFALRGPS